MATVEAVTAEGAGTSLSDTDIKDLQSALRGELIPRDHGSMRPARRVWNGNIDRRPALIRAARVSPMCSRRSTSRGRTASRSPRAAAATARPATAPMTAAW